MDEGVGSVGDPRETTLAETSQYVSRHSHHLRGKNASV